MSGSLSFDDLERLVGNRFGMHRRPCPLCSPYRKPPHRKEPVLTIWREEADFIRFYCNHCEEARGWTRRDGEAAKVDLYAYREKRALADRRGAEHRRDRTRRALEIWIQAGPIAGTIAERYLANRSIDVDALPGDMLDVLRWHPRCPWEQGTAPGLVAVWTSVRTGEPRAIHRTLISSEAKRLDRRSFGPTAGCVIRLWADDAVEQGLIIGEGIETVLAAATRVEHKATLLQPAWACGDKGHLSAFPVLAGIEALTILVDNDPSGDGQRAAEACARRWLEEGREVVRLTPRLQGTDFNDLVEAP